MELFWRPSSRKLLYSGVRIIWLGAAILVASLELALSEQFSGTPAEACLAVNRYLSLEAQLPRTAARLKVGRTALNRSHWVFLDGRVMGPSLRRHLSGSDAPRTR